MKNQYQGDDCRERKNDQQGILGEILAHVIGREAAGLSSHTVVCVHVRIMSDSQMPEQSRT